MASYEQQLFAREVKRNGRPGRFVSHAAGIEGDVYVHGKRLMPDPLGGSLEQDRYEYRLAVLFLEAEGITEAPAKDDRVWDSFDETYRTVEYAQPLYAKGVIVGYKVLAIG